MPQLYKLLKTTLIIAMSLFLINCGSSDEEKLVKEHNSLAQEINSLGTPSTDWSEKELESYIAKLNKLERLTSEAESEEGVYGGYGNESVIASKRAYAYQILNRKRSLLSHQSKSEKIQKLLAEFIADREELLNSSAELDMLSEKSVKDFLNRTEQVIEKSEQIESLIVSLDTVDANAKTKMLNALLESTKDIVGLKDSLKKHLVVLSETDVKGIKSTISNDPKSIEAFGMSIVNEMLTLAQAELKLDTTDKQALIAHHKKVTKLQDNMDTFTSMIKESKDIPQYKKDDALRKFQPAIAQIEIAEKNILDKILAFDVEEVSTEETEKAVE